jgi:hypothetical protein
MVDCIHYRSGYEYQLKKTVTLSTRIRPDEEVVIDGFVRLGVDGTLEIRNGYAWDGPSGPTIDTRNFMRGSLVHDALYQLMREADLDKATWRKTADEELVRFCGLDGMSRVRRWWVLKAVRRFADLAASPASRKPISRAPHGCIDTR